MTIALLLVFLALLCAGYAFHRWRQAALKRQKQRERQQRHREQQEAWDRMLRETGLDAQPEGETPI